MNRSKKQVVAARKAKPNANALDLNSVYTLVWESRNAKEEMGENKYIEIFLNILIIFFMFLPFLNV